jgi:G3E family GTPase
MSERVPVTILSGFLGSGKTTLLNHILGAQHGQRIAVIENEFGEAGIDAELLAEASADHIVEMNNGCICCSVRDDLVQILASLDSGRRAGQLRFDRVLIETTGLADPAPVAQTFIVNLDVARRYVLDGIVTLVDAKHGGAQLDRHAQAQAQVGFADRILLSKTDLVSEEEADSLVARLRRMNPRARLERVHFGKIDLAAVLDIRGFDLDAILEVDAAFLDPHREHRHDDEVGSFVFRDTRPLDAERFDVFMGLLVKQYGADLLRCKGVVNFRGRERRTVFQGVHAMLGAQPGRAWAGGEARETVLVFIGRNLPRHIFEEGLRCCLAGE